MTSEHKSISVREFVEFGYLQELNRGFFLFLGSALAVSVDEQTGEYSLSDIIWDHRADLEGIIYGLDSLPESGKSQRITAERERRRPVREAVLGYWQQPVPESN